MRIIVALSGGKASAWCADWALKNFDRNKVILYFNDTGWEHPDLYRFLKDLERFFKKDILHDSDGRTPEQVFYDKKFLANSQRPICSRILKAERLQKFYQHEDILIFGIGAEETKRAARITGRYQVVTAKTGKYPVLHFPIIEMGTSKREIDLFFKKNKIKTPLLYDLKFTHNNCSGGCVRAGKKQWKRLYETLPGIYLDRERVEKEVSEHLGKDVHFFKDETLEAFRKKIEAGDLSSYYDDEEPQDECIGICEYLS